VSAPPASLSVPSVLPYEQKAGFTLVTERSGGFTAVVRFEFEAGCGRDRFLPEWGGGGTAVVGFACQAGCGRVPSRVREPPETPPVLP